MASTRVLSEAGLLAKRRIMASLPLPPSSTTRSMGPSAALIASLVPQDMLEPACGGSWSRSKLATRRPAVLAASTWSGW